MLIYVFLCLNATATTEIDTYVHPHSLPDARPICLRPFEGKGSGGARLFCHRPPEDAKGAMLECPQCQRAASNRRGRVVLVEPGLRQHLVAVAQEDRKSTRLNSSH